MPAHAWPAGAALLDLVLAPTPEDRTCPGCGRRRWICDHRHHPVETFHGPRRLVCKLLKCPDKTCSMAGKTFSPMAEAHLAHPRWIVDWEVFAWIGHRRFARHWSLSQIGAELADTHHIRLSEAVLFDYVTHYQRMVAARHEDPNRLAELYSPFPDLRLSIDGLQPEKGHETLYVVRELNAGIVWFATPLLSSTADELERLFQRARDIAAALGKPISSWISDKQDAFLTGIAKVFPAVPHRLCKLHFLRALAADVTAADRHVKVQTRKKVRGLAAIEREVLAARASGSPSPASAAQSTPAVEPPLVPQAPSHDGSLELVAASSPAEPPTPVGEPAASVASAPSVVLDYCAVVRGILNDDQGDALNPSGLRMAAALQQVSASLARAVAGEKTLPPTHS